MEEKNTSEKAVSLKKRAYLFLLAFPLGILWMELVIKVWDFGTIWNRGLWFTTLFTFAIGIAVSLLCTIWTKQVNRILALLFMGGLTIFYAVQAVYYTVLRTVMAVFSVSGAKDATEFWRVGMLGVWNTLPAIIALLVPFVCFCIFSKKAVPDHLLGKKHLFGMLILIVLFQGAGILSVRFSNSGIMSPWAIYTDQFNPKLSTANFGVLTTLRLEMTRAVFPLEEEPVFLEEPIPAFGKMTGAKDSAEANMLNLDFETLAAQESDSVVQGMHHYFAAKNPTFKNAYTGRFQGKNLIMITAEAFCTLAVDPERTPTLYRLSHEGFVCQNYYNPLWWASTSDGEYVACNSLIPKSGVLSFAASANNSLYFSLGHQLSAQGYDTRAYHNHTYTYYQRDKSHPNMGYVYKGLGNGLNVTEIWPESDLEMMELSIPEYINKAPFHVYYTTMSGHLNYSYMGNNMSAKHRAEVENLPLSEEAQAYLACQMELELALQYLLDQLEQAGQLENTVICLSGDHYPYGLSKETIDELAGHKVDETFELYHSTLILWSGDMKETVEIDKTCQSLDILPTLSNLFGLEYDSRLLMGRDILSDSPGLAVFSDCSYITELGRYSAKEDTFTPNPAVEVPDGYAKQKLKEVQDMFTISGKMLDSDYYRKLGLVWEN